MTKILIYLHVYKEWVTWSLALEVKRLGCEVDHSPPSLEIRNACSYASTPQYAFMAWLSVIKAQGQLYLYLIAIKNCLPDADEI
jgi:hypothetical protein